MIKVLDLESKRMDARDLEALTVEMEVTVDLNPLMMLLKRLAKMTPLILNLTISVKRPNTRDLEALVETIKKQQEEKEEVLFG